VNLLFDSSGAYVALGSTQEEALGRASGVAVRSGPWWGPGGQRDGRWNALREAGRLARHAGRGARLAAEAAREKALTVLQPYSHH